MTEMDRICLSGLRAYGYHGVLPAERERGQEFIVDVVLWLDTSAAAETDDLSKTVDYGSLASRLAEIVSGEPVALLEKLAQRLAAACLAEDYVQHAEDHRAQASGASRRTSQGRQRDDQAEP